MIARGQRPKSGMLEIGGWRLEDQTGEVEDRGRKVELEEGGWTIEHKVARQSNQNKGGWTAEPEGKRLDS
jgi:hypothetical protein